MCKLFFTQTIVKPVNIFTGYFVYKFSFALFTSPSKNLLSYESKTITN